MDWNWFFSSASQSVAALVGVLGAFLVARVLGNEATFTANRSRTAELIARGQQLADRADSRYFEWYNKSTLEDELKDLRRDIRDVEDTLLAEDYYRGYGFSRYMPKQQVVDAVQGVIDRETQRRQNPPKPRTTIDIAAGITDLSVPRLGLDDERDEINALVVAVKGHMRDVQAHLATIRANPERSPLVWVVLIALILLFFGGVAYPLSLLPVGGGGATIPFFAFTRDLAVSRAAILSFTAVVFSILIVLIGVSSERLKHSEADIQGLERWLSADSYSTYLRYRVDNGFPL